MAGCLAWEGSLIAKCAFTPLLTRAKTKELLRHALRCCPLAGLNQGRDKSCASKHPFDQGRLLQGPVWCQCSSSQHDIFLSGCADPCVERFVHCMQAGGQLIHGVCWALHLTSTEAAALHICKIIIKKRQLRVNTVFFPLVVKKASFKKIYYTSYMSVLIVF